MDLDTSGHDLLDMASECIDIDDLGNAKELIEMAIAQAPANGSIIFWAAVRLSYAER